MGDEATAKCERAIKAPLLLRGRLGPQHAQVLRKPTGTGRSQAYPCLLGFIKSPILDKPWNKLLSSKTYLSDTSSSEGGIVTPAAGIAHCAVFHV